MPRFEYKVVPAPKKAGKIKGIKGTDNKFAAELATLMNLYGSDGWEYQRTDTLPCEERQGFTGRTTTFQNMLIFRKKIEDPAKVALITSAPEPVAGPTLAVPTFRATHNAPQGVAPQLGAASTPEPAQAAPSIAAQ